MATKVTEQIATATPNVSHPNPLISHDKLRQLYSTMLQCRLLDERVQSQNKPARFDGNNSSYTSREATAVGTAIDLRPEDTMAPSHEDFILSYVKGMPLTAIFSQLRGHIRPGKEGQVGGRRRTPRRNVTAAPPNFGTQMDLGASIAVANQRKRNDNVVMAFSSEDSISPKEWRDALHLAGQSSLPIVFVRQSDRSPVSASVKSESPSGEAGSETVGYGFPEIPVDGNDVVAVYRVAQEAIERARSGGGPTLIEAQTYHGNHHFEIGPEKYPAQDQAAGWRSRDPIAAMERYLAGKNLFSDAWKRAVTENFLRELNAAFEVAERDPSGTGA